MVNAFNYSNTAQQTALTGSISAGATSINVGATTGFPSSFPYILAIDFGAATEELVSVTAAATTTLTVTRGFGSTSAQSHSIGAVVRHVFNAVDATDFRTHEQATGAVHGLTGNIVGTTDTQTLTNKTLTSPVINTGTWNDGTLSGTIAGTPTFSGLHTHTAEVKSNRTGSTDAAYTSTVSAEGNPRLSIRADGQIAWGPGSGATDTTLARSSAGTLVVGSHLSVTNLTSLGTATLTVASTSSNMTVGGDLIVNGIGEIQRLYKTVDTSRSSTTTPTDDPALTSNVISGARYIFECGIFLGPNTAGADFQCTFGGTANGTLIWSGTGAHNSLTTGSQADGEWIARDNVTTATPYAASQTAGVHLGVHAYGTLDCTVSGNFALQWAQQTSNATATVVKRGSYFRVERIA